MSHVSSFGSVGFVLVCVNLPTWTSHTMIPSPKLHWSDDPTSVHEIDSDNNHSAQNDTGYKCTSHPIPSEIWNSAAITPAPQSLARYRISVLVRRHRVITKDTSGKPAQDNTGYKCTSHPIPSENWNSAAITPAPQFLARNSLARVRISAAITPAPRPLARYRNSVLVRRHRIVLTQSSVQKEAPKTIAYQDPSCL